MLSTQKRPSTLKKIVLVSTALLSLLISTSLALAGNSYSVETSKPCVDDKQCTNTTIKCSNGHYSNVYTHQKSDRTLYFPSGSAEQASSFDAAARQSCSAQTISYLDIPNGALVYRSGEKIKENLGHKDAYLIHREIYVKTGNDDYAFIANKSKAIIVDKFPRKSGDFTGYYKVKDKSGSIYYITEYDAGIR